MLYLMVGAFKNIGITYDMDLDKRIKYIESILRVEALKKYRQVLSECKDLTNKLTGDQWNLGSEKGLTTEQF